MAPAKVNPQTCPPIFLEDYADYAMFVVDELGFPINANPTSFPCGTKILDLIGDFL